MARMQRRHLCAWGCGSVWAAPDPAPGTTVLRVARLHVPGWTTRRPGADAPDRPQAPDLGLELCQGIGQVDPGLRFTVLPTAMTERALVEALAHHRLDLHWDLVATPRRRERMAFVDGPVLWRHRLQLACHAADPDPVPDLVALQQGAAQHRLVAAAGSVAAEFLAAQPGLRWLPVDTDEAPERLLRGGARWALLPSHAQARLAPRAMAGVPERPVSWRWQPLVLQDAPVHGAVSLAVPAPVRQRLAQALARLAHQGGLDALKVRHARA